MVWPTIALEKLVERYQGQLLSRDHFLEGLDQFEDYLAHFWGSLEDLPPDSPLADAIQKKVELGVSLYEECLEILREWIDTQEPDLLVNLRQLTRKADSTLLDVLDESAEEALNLTSG